MAVSIEEVSGNAERCSDVARHSVEVAHKGGEAVRRTIAGMNTIRETIQDTSKRIKRLGESSQEIGNIVELIGSKYYVDFPGDKVAFDGAEHEFVVSVAGQDAEPKPLTLPLIKRPPPKSYVSCTSPALAGA